MAPAGAKHSLIRSVRIQNDSRRAQGVTTILSCVNDTRIAVFKQTAGIVAVVAAVGVSDMFMLMTSHLKATLFR
jgi:hypothetical protein